MRQLDAEVLIDALCWIGSDGQVLLPRSEVDIANQAFHALPYLGLRVAPSDNTVLQAFGQLDVPLNSNPVK